MVFPSISSGAGATAFVVAEDEGIVYFFRRQMHQMHHRMEFRRLMVLLALRVFAVVSGCLWFARQCDAVGKGGCPKNSGKRWES